MSVTQTFRDRLASGRPILADGAMGTQLYERLGYRYVCFEELNVTEPGVVQSVHRAYMEAGAELIETNTFACNRFLLGSRGLERHVERFAQAGARIAREAQEALGVPAFIAGSIGPLNRTLGLKATDMRSAFREVAEGLLIGGVDLFILETFGSLEELLIALDVCRECASLPVIASMTFSEDGRSLAGEEPQAIARALTAAGADVIGANCGFGPQPTEEIIGDMSFPGAAPLSAMPNAGLPARRDGRLVYSSGPEYFREYAKNMLALGVRIVGGCCGTTPTHTSAMAQAVGYREIEPGSAPVPTLRSETSYAPAAIEIGSQPVKLSEPSSRFRSALEKGDFVINVELRPPRGANPNRVLQAAELLKQAGVTAVDVTDSALGRVRMSSFATAVLIQSRINLDVVAHLTTRDRNLMALQADLIGAHALGIRHVLALTGDPPNSNSWAPTSGVYDVDSIGLISLISRLNAGIDAAGMSIGSPTRFLVGCSFNATAEDISAEAERLHRKLEAGADFVITQAVYDPALFLEARASLGEVRVPFILELLPLQSYRNALFIHNELPGVTIPRSVLERMHAAGSRGAETGLRIAVESLEALMHAVQGVYIVPSFDRYQMAAELIHESRRLIEKVARGGGEERTEITARPSHIGEV